MAEHRVRCPYCGRLFSGTNEARVYRELEDHIKRDHKDEK